MTDIQSMVAEAAEGAVRPDYLDNGTHTVTVQKAEIKTGDDAYPKWATKTLSMQLGNDEGIRFADFEMEPLTSADGNPNTTSQKILIQNLVGLGVNLESASTIEDVIARAVTHITNGSAQGAVLEININDKPSGKMNTVTNKPYMYRNTYINKLVEAGIGDSSAGVAAVQEAFDAEEIAAF